MTQNAPVQTGMVFPSAGVRILIPLVVAAFMEEASGESLNNFSDYNIGASVGSVPAAAFSLAANGAPQFRARDVLYTTFATALAMFSRDPKTMMTNNLRRDVSRMAPDYLHGFVGHGIARHLEHSRPTREAALYDHGLLKDSLHQRFGDTRTVQSQKPFFIIAHEMGDSRAAVFGDINSPDTPDQSLYLDSVSHYRDVPVKDAIMAATAIAGVIGFYRIEELGKTFMDIGSLAATNYFGLMDDMHDITSQRLKALKPSAQRAWWKLRGNNQDDQTPPLVSRMLYMGVGDDKPPAFEDDGDKGMLLMIPELFRNGGDHISGSAAAHIKKKFNHASIAHTNAPALRVVDLPIQPRNAEEAAVFPNNDIKDGQLDNLMRLMAFGRRVVLANREILCDEIILRMKTLEARGLRTPQQVEAVEKRMNIVRGVEAADAVCDQFLFKVDEVAGILQEQGLRDASRYTIPAPVPVKRGWFPRLASSALAFV